MKKNPLKLNKLQARTLVLLQVLARQEGNARPVEGTEGVEILSLPHAHGNHFHVGPFVVASADANGLYNDAVWKVLDRKGLAHRPNPLTVVLTKAGQDYDTGLGHHFLEHSDH